MAQKTISLRLDEELYNISKDRAVMQGIGQGRYINRAVEFLALYEDYQQLGDIDDYATFEEYYKRKCKHKHRPSVYRYY